MRNNSSLHYDNNLNNKIEDQDIPEILLQFGQDKLGRRFLTYDEEIFSDLSQPRLHVRVVNVDGQEKLYPIFQQNAMQYEEYSDYMRMHGCACCSLTTMLAAMRRNYSRYMPQDTIKNVEKKYISWHEFDKNYGKSLPRQMPISLYGISKILTEENISNHYVGYFKRMEGYDVIARHLLSGNPVIFETSRIRYHKNFIRSIHDTKYAGSYHTMIMLGIDTKGMVIFTDSATRNWAGKQQRLKRAELDDLINYMFPQKRTEDSHAYFTKRRNTGGFILVKTWKKD